MVNDKTNQIKDAVTEIFLVRHGETCNNKLGFYTGALDIPLTSKSKKQAFILAEKLAKISFDSIYSSGLRRANESAQPLADKLGLKLKFDPGFREINFGKWEGLSASEIQDKYKKVWNDWCYNTSKVKFPGGESFKIFKVRVLSALGRVLDNERGKTVAVFCHGGTIRLIVLSILEGKFTMMPRLVQHNFAMTHLIFYGNVAMINGVYNLDDKNILKML